MSDGEGKGLPEIQQEPKLVLRPARLTMTGTGQDAGTPVTTALTESYARVQMQAATSSEIRTDIAGVEKFTGEVGDLNHFLRAIDSIATHIDQMLLIGRLDVSDVGMIRRALNRRVHRRVLNRLQADEGMAWLDIRSRLQKEYGGGRWSPEEDALRLFQTRRGPRQSKGEFAAQMVAAFDQVVNKLRETNTTADAETVKVVYERLMKVHLKEETGAVGDKEFLVLANELIDAAGRGQEPQRMEYEDRGQWTRRTRRPVEHRPVRRERVPEQRRDMAPRRTARPGQQERRRGDQRCYTCGKAGHIQARCNEIKCFECGTRGHMARSCPYMKRRNGPRDEPMEINYGLKKEGRRKRPEKQMSGSETDDSEREGSTTESGGRTEEEASLHSYAAVCSRRLPQKVERKSKK